MAAKCNVIVTVYDFLKLEKKKGFQMAMETGLSQSAISKLKLNQAPMTKNTKELLESTYPQYIFTAEGLDSNWVWKDRYQEMLDMNKQLIRENRILEAKLRDERKRADKAVAILESR